MSSGGESILGAFEIMLPGIEHHFGSNKCIEIKKERKEEERKGIL